MDKAWAVRAGLGWIGKHTNLITRDYGSWVFLGELLLDLELEYDDGRASKTTAAPARSASTRARPGPSSSLTSSIRTSASPTRPSSCARREIPDAVAANLDGWLYGCDVCQDVCPWNRFEQPTTEPRFEPRPGTVSPDLAEIVELTPDAYAERFRRSPVKRAKLSGLQRNARTLLKI